MNARSDRFHALNAAALRRAAVRRMTRLDAEIRRCGAECDGATFKAEMFASARRSVAMARRWRMRGAL